MTVSPDVEPSTETLVGRSLDFADAAGADAHGANATAADVAQPVTISVATPTDASEWDAFVASQADATGYHVWAWRSVFERAFGHGTIYLLARRGATLRGVLPLVQINSRLFGRTLTSLPFLNYGGVLGSDQAIGDALVSAAVEIARSTRCRHVELRHRERRFAALPGRQHKVSMLLPLENMRWEGLDKKVRNQIRKAQKSELTVERGGVDLLPDFYQVFARNMRDLGTPVYGRAFFSEILRTFPAQAHLHVVRLGSLPIAAGLTYHSRRTLEIPWASSVRDHNHLCPNHMLYWDVIEYATAIGCSVFDFGRSTPGEGTFKFKEQWGAVPLPLHWEYALVSGTEVPDASPTNPKYAAAIAAWQRLPLPLANALGPLIVRSIP